MAEHKLKCWSVYWDAIERGDKNFEVRRDDRGFQKGDILVLLKWNREAHMYESRPKVSPRYDYEQEIPELRRRVLYVLTGGQLGIEAGYVVMALGPEGG